MARAGRRTSTTPSRRRASNTRFRVHLLDMGQTKYGDCILCEIGERTILIDAGHPGDHRPRGATPALQDQIGSVLGASKPFKVDLLVVTHTHSDHIGCMAALVNSGTLAPKVALLADPDLGYGGADGADAYAGESASATAVLEALREDVDHTRLSDAELAELLASVDGQQDTYREMIATLEEQGVKVILYQGEAQARTVEGLFDDIGLRILGPTKSHLGKCAEYIGRLGRDAADQLAARAHDAAERPVALLRSIAESLAHADTGADKPGSVGAAVNDQSIVISFEFAGRKALLTGDMQLAEPEVPGLETSMRALLEKIRAGGPYEFVKTSHHSSYNGMNEDVLAAIGRPVALAHSGGLQDPTHPDPELLKLLERSLGETRWARTDRNGRISVDLGGREVGIDHGRGELDDFRRNPAKRRDDPAEAVAEPAAPAPAVTVRPVRRSSGSSNERVEITASVPHAATRITLTVEVQPLAHALEPEDPPAQPAPPRDVERLPQVAGRDGRLAAGRHLPKLLVVTHPDALRKNVGRVAADDALWMVRESKQQLLTLEDPSNVQRCVDQVRDLITGSDFRGVVLLGGADVVPSQRLDVLPATLRARLGGAVRSDPDSFVVWSDDAYGDMNDDMEPELPVSRIPDGHDAALLMSALTTAPARSVRPRAGIRNSARPFADAVFSKLPGEDKIHKSGPAHSHTISDGKLGGDHVYIMLHGSDVDGTQFWGEDYDANYIVGVERASIPALRGAVVMAGCCWGALFANTRANVPTTQTTGRETAQSLALSFLANGARAFVGCTGVHYSPTLDPYNYFGGPLHEAFWANVVAGKPPAEALLEAKRAYRKGLPHTQRTPTGEAIELKILRQFTCLGLGW